MRPDELLRRAKQFAENYYGKPHLFEAEKIVRDLIDALEETQKELQHCRQTAENRMADWDERFMKICEELEQVKAEVPCPKCFGAKNHVTVFVSPVDENFVPCPTCKGSGKKYNAEKAKGD